jgi:tripartite-type tricarboxylate transporter receptor subunit TctC
MLTIRRKCITLALALLSGLSAWPWLAWGQSYPSKPITLIIPFPPGGPTDVTGRVLAEKLSLALKQQVVVDNRAGASGNVGAVAAARAAPDGYTLFFATGGTHGINPSLYRNAGFDPIRDFAPVAWITVSPNIIVVHPSFPATTVKELIDLAKANPDKYSSAAPGQGSTPHMAGELFKRAAGIAIVHVPYKGSGPALNDVMGGHIPIMFDGIPSAMPHIRAGRLRALGVTSLQRVPTAPDIPTVAETLPGFEANGWFALFAPAGTPTEIVNKLNAEVNRILDQPDVKQRYAGLGAITVGGPPEKLRDQVKAEVERWGELIRATQMKVE